MRCYLGWHTEPCPQEDLGSACHTEEGHYCPRLQVGTRWAEVACEEELVQAHQQLVAFARTLGLRPEDHPRAHAAGRRLDDVHHRPCAVPLPPSSLPSTLSESP
jgi:hypothetical protein